MEVLNDLLMSESGAVVETPPPFLLVVYATCLRSGLDWGCLRTRRTAYNMTIIGYSLKNTLANPPNGIGDKLVTACLIKLSGSSPFL